MSLRRIAMLPVLCLALLVATARAQATAPALAGRIEGRHYVSPTGAFRIEIPVLPELGGSITDTEAVVTFQDDFNAHASIACFKMDASQRWENETRGRKEYLIWFFANFIQADFQQRFPGARIESAKFLPSLQGGALLTYNQLPGGSMFAAKLITIGDEVPPTAKRGNLLFVRGENVFIISIELAEKVLERTSFGKTVKEEDDILYRRLTNLLAKISFAPATPDNPSGATAG